MRGAFTCERLRVLRHSREEVLARGRLHRHSNVAWGHLLELYGLLVSHCLVVLMLLEAASFLDQLCAWEWFRRAHVHSFWSTLAKGELGSVTHAIQTPFHQL